MLDVQRLDAVQCTTALEVELLAALVVERRLRSRLELAAKPKPEPEIVAQPIALAESPPAPPEEPPAHAQLWLRVERPAGRNAKIIDIQREVCRKFGFTLTELRSQRRDHRICMARHVAVVLCYALTLHSYPQIGRWFGGRDHTTMLHSVEKYKWVHTLLCEELTPNDSIATWVKRAHQHVMAGRAVATGSDVGSELVVDIKAERACLAQSLGG